MENFSVYSTVHIQVGASFTKEGGKKEGEGKSGRAGLQSNHRKTHQADWMAESSKEEPSEATGK